MGHPWHHDQGDRDRRAVREAQRRHDDPIAAILSVEPGKLLYKGKVIDVARRATEGFLRGVCGSTGSTT